MPIISANASGKLPNAKTHSSFCSTVKHVSAQSDSRVTLSIGVPQIGTLCNARKRSLDDYVDYIRYMVTTVQWL